MEFWPADFRENTSPSSTSKGRKGKAIYESQICFEPGSLGAATLTSEDSRLRWITAAQSRRSNIPQVVGRALEIFPPTKYFPPSLPRLSLHQRAEQGARFLRKYHSDVHIPFEIIKDELQSDDDEAGAYSKLDPYSSNRLAHSSFGNGENHAVKFLAFPSGETGAELNVLLSRNTSDEQVTFDPRTTVASSFNTPIQQIVSFSSDTTYYNSPLLAIRTHSNITVTGVHNSPVDQSGRPDMAITTVASVSLIDTGKHRVVDVCGNFFTLSDAQLLLVNETGSVYCCNIAREMKIMAISSSISESEPSEADQVWRVVRKDVNLGLRSSSKTVQLFDMRTHSDPSLVFDVKEKSEWLTSIEKPLPGGHLMCFSTTNKLVWFDERSQRAPVFAIKHQRAHDRTLRVETVNYGSAPFAMLSSSTNALVTVYDINYGGSGYMHAYGGPSMLVGSPSVALPLTGFAHFGHDTGFHMFQLSSSGSLWKTKVAFTPNAAGGTIEDSETFRRTEHTKTLPDELSLWDGREYLDANLRAAYEKIFQVPFEALEDPETVFQTLERMPFFWQDLDGTIEHMFLTFDIAFRSGMEPTHPSRADFLTECPLNSARGFAALMTERVPIHRLVSTARWYHDLRSLPSSIVPDIATRSQDLINKTQGEALVHAATGEGMKRAIKAAQCLAVDLSLSRHVYSMSFSNIGPSKNADDPNMLLQATKAMSLEVAKPPQVQFGFLHPVIKDYNEDDQKEDSDEMLGESVELPLGVRLLLSQWEVGGDPRRYVYKDPYAAEEAAPTLRKKQDHRSDQGQKAAAPSAQLVPPVVASTSRASVAGMPSVGTSSVVELGTRKMSDTFSRPWGSQNIQGESFSWQEQGPSTQPLPGVHGGGSRQLTKVSKKRIGGF